MINKVAVIGAGGVGSFFISGLSGILGKGVFAIAEGGRKEKLLTDGLMLNGERMDVEVKTPEEAKGAGLIIVCVKYNSLPLILNDIEAIAGEDTIILCPMNGLDSEEIIASRHGKKHIIHSMMRITAERHGNDIVYHHGTEPCVHIGVAEGYASQEDLDQVAELFEKAGLAHKIRSNIIKAIWNKFALNISTNIAQAVIGCGYGAYKISPNMNELGQRLCEEVIDIADAMGVECSFDYQESLRTAKINDIARLSTLQDLDSGRHTEVDMFCGTVVKLGRQVNVPTPFNEFAYLAIKALEEKNDGMIK